jgi:hypothetical protein
MIFSGPWATCIIQVIVSLEYTKLCPLRLFAGIRAENFPYKRHEMVSGDFQQNCFEQETHGIFNITSFDAPMEREVVCLSALR